MGSRLRDPASWLRLVMGVSSRNLGPTFVTITVRDLKIKTDQFLPRFLRVVAPPRDPLEALVYPCIELVHGLEDHSYMTSALRWKRGYPKELN